MITYKVVERKNLKTEEPVFFAQTSKIPTVKMSLIAQEISQECTVTPHDILAVISAMEERIIGHLQQGQSVRFGLLGSFRPTVKSKSAPSLEEFTADNIRGLAVAYTPSTTIKYQLSLSNPNVDVEREA